MAKHMKLFLILFYPFLNIIIIIYIYVCVCVYIHTHTHTHTQIRNFLTSAYFRFRRM